MNQTQGNSFTIGVIGNRQLYEGATIARYEQTLLRGVRAAAREYGCHLLLACGVGPDTAPFEALPAWPLSLSHTNFVPVGPWNTAGLIAIPPFTDDQMEALRSTLPTAQPLVFTSPQTGYLSVGPANQDGIAQAFAHLVAHGHRRIAFMAADELAGSDAAERLAAYRAALGAHGLPWDAALVAYGGHEEQQAYTAMGRMIAGGVDCTAVLASNDESAIGVMRALTDAGRRIPQDVAVIGFDDVLYAKGQTPPLTTVRHPTFELGYRAVELLLDDITGARSGSETVRVPTRLIIRESCGCQPYSMPVLSPAGTLVRGNEELGAWEVQALSQSLADAVAVEAQSSNLGLISEWSEKLVAAFHISLARQDAEQFTVTLDRLFEAMETANEDVYIWQAAIFVLRDYVARQSTEQRQTQQLAESLIDQARVRISERLRRQHTRYLERQAAMTEHLGTLTARLLTALQPEQILAALADHLPALGVQHAYIVLFEAEDDDPVAWSRAFIRSADGPPSIRRFASRQFPPPDLYPPSEPWRLALLPLIIEGGPTGFVAFDVAYLEPLGLIVRHLAAAFRNTQLHAAAEAGRQQAEEANRLKSRFLSTVSHELRTPLNLIVGLSEMLLRERADPTTPAEIAIQDLERIFVNAQHLGRLIGDVLDLASSEAGQLRLYQEPLDLAEVLQPVITTGSQMAQEKGIAWHAHLPPTGPWVRGDRTRLRQVAINLLSNATKFTERGSITLELTVDTTQAMVAIHDTGLGVPLHDQQRIFDEFRSSERTADRAYGGLGLGLAICKQLIERHGGTISVHSSGKEDGGATFCFSLPLLAAHPAEAVAEPVLMTDRQRVVLLHEQTEVDDGLSELLNQRGFAVQIQRIDADADWLGRLITLPPAALILDAPLASRRGWEILGVLKRHPTTARLPVLMYALDPHAEHGSLVELDYRQKPLDIEQLTEALELQRTWDDQPSNAKTILVVDDDPDTLALHTRLVRQQLPDSRVIQARNGREALAMMEQVRPNLVLLDLNMPQLDGFGVLQAMRAQEATRDVPVVVLTAQILTDDDIARLNSGVAALLSKGMFTSDEIVEHIASALGRQRKVGTSIQQIVRRAVAFIHTHYAEPITRDQLAAQLSVSADHLTASFREEMGITPITYINRYRIGRARTLLEESSRSVTDIALMVGFTDLANFSRTFHREVGLSPNAYRRSKPR